MEEMPEIKAPRKKWIYFLKQLMVCSGVWAMFFNIGQFAGSPTVFIPQLQKTSPEPLDDEMVSWLYSVSGVATIPWVFILSAVTRSYGLRLPYIMGCIGFLLTYVVFWFSNSPLQILISEIIFGICQASALTVGIVIVSEYTSPEYRGIFLTFKSASFFWGIWSANATGTYFHWKNIAYSGFLCSVYMLTSVFWPESPQWLASKQRFNECRKAYYWLQGHDEKTEKDVEELISSQIKAKRVTGSNNDWSNMSSAIRTIRSREFYGPLLLIILLVTQYHATGKLVWATYVIDILKKMTSSESTAYTGMLILDGVTVASMYFGCFLSKVLNRRTLYLASSITGITFLFVISLYLYLVKLTVISESKVLSIVILTCFSIAISCGPMIMSTSIYAELIPLRFKNVLVVFSALLFYIYSTVLLKVAPNLFKSLGMHGTFLVYGIVASVSTALLFKYLPETKDKTLQEIEHNFKEYNIPDSDREKVKNLVGAERN